MVHVLRFIVGLVVLGGGVAALCWAVITPGWSQSILAAFLLLLVVVTGGGAFYAVGWFCHEAWQSLTGRGR